MKLIINASEILQIKDYGDARKGKTMENLDILKDHAIYIENEIIKDILPQDEALKKYKDAEIIDAENNVVMPGFCDSHTHLVFAGSRADEFEMRIKGASYMEIMEKGGGIQNTVNATRKISEDELYDISKKRLYGLYEYGTTTVEIKSGYGLEKESELKQLNVANRLKEINPDIKTTFMGAHSLPPEFSNNSDYLDYLEKNIFPEIADGHLADFIDIFCEKGVFTPKESEKHLLNGKKIGLIPKMHADELAYSQAAEVASKVGAISADHLLKASQSALNNMADNGIIATLLPATLYNLATNEYPDARFMIDQAKVPVALASDFNPGSCYCENLFLTIHLACQYLKMTPAEALIGVTINGAYAMNTQKNSGSIEIGKNADILILDCIDYKHIPYHFGINPILTTIKRGKIVYKKNRNQ